ncbi:MAG: Hsp20/alpha crystallin family protein [Planctomycetota bacterium]|jgi:HSP20 family protein|nr:Hsp20/alpha crystallin family protein [Planctomycetota bacterium]
MLNNYEKEGTAVTGGQAIETECSQINQAIPSEAERAELRRPAVDIVASDSEVLLILDVPGVRDNGIDVSVEKNVLSVKAVPVANDTSGRRLLYAEYRSGEYRRSFSLPDDADRDNITAALKEGVLRIRLPKIAPASKKIQVANG